MSALKKDGSTFSAEIQEKTIPYNGRNIRVISIRDITAQKQMEKDLKERVKELACLHGISQLINTAIDQRDRFGYWHP